MPFLYPAQSFLRVRYALLPPQPCTATARRTFSGHLLPSRTQVFHLRFVFTQALPTGKAPFSLWAVVSPARRSRSPAAERAGWGSLGFVPQPPGGLRLYRPPQILQSSTPVGPRRPGPGFSGFHYVTPYYFDDATVLLNHHPSNINYICIKKKKNKKIYKTHKTWNKVLKILRIFYRDNISLSIAYYSERTWKHFSCGIKQLHLFQHLDEEVLLFVLSRILANLIWMEEEPQTIMCRLIPPFHTLSFPCSEAVILKHNTL